MSFSKPAFAFTPSWRAETARPVPPDAKAAQNDARHSLTSAVFYTQPSGVGLFPEGEWIKALISKLRRR